MCELMFANSGDRQHLLFNEDCVRSGSGTYRRFNRSVSKGARGSRTLFSYAHALLNILRIDCTPDGISKLHAIRRCRFRLAKLSHSSPQFQLSQDVATAEEQVRQNPRISTSVDQPRLGLYVVGLLAVMSSKIIYRLETKNHTRFQGPFSKCHLGRYHQESPLDAPFLWICQSETVRGTYTVHTVTYHDRARMGADLKH